MQARGGWYEAHTTCCWRCKTGIHKSNNLYCWYRYCGHRNHSIQIYNFVGVMDWLAFGVGKHLRYLSVHDISCTMGQVKCQSLLTFHSFTGSDQTSLFAHKGKKTAWEAWDIFEEITPVFHSLSSAPSLSAVTDAIPIVERYVAIMYDPTSACTKVNEARKDLLARKGREIDAIPPTADALS